MRHKGPDDDATSSTDLDRLLATEVELEAMYVRAREEAQRLVQAASAEVGEASLDLDRELSASQAQFQAEVDAERARRAAEVLAEARMSASELDAVPEARIVALGRIALERLLGMMAS